MKLTGGAGLKARVETALQVGEDLFGSPLDRVSGLVSLAYKKTISSPLNESLSGTDTPKNHPCYHHDWQDNNGVYHIECTPVDDIIAVSISREEFSTVLNVCATVDGSLSQSSLVKGSSRFDFTKRVFAEALPEHFFPKHRHDTTQYLTKCVVQTAGSEAE